MRDAWIEMQYGAAYPDLFPEYIGDGAVTFAGTQMTSASATDIYYDMMFDEGPRYMGSYTPIAPQSGGRSHFVGTRRRVLENSGAFEFDDFRSLQGHKVWGGRSHGKRDRKRTAWWEGVANRTRRNNEFRSTRIEESWEQDSGLSTWDEMASWLDDMAAQSDEVIERLWDHNGYYDRMLKLNGINMAFYDRHWDGLDHPNWEQDALDEIWREDEELRWAYEAGAYYRNPLDEDRQDPNHGFVMDPFEEACLAEPDYYDGGWDDPYYDDYGTYDYLDEEPDDQPEVITLNGQPFEDYDYSNWPEFNISPEEWAAMEAEDLAIERAFEAEAEELEARFEHFPANHGQGRKTQIGHLKSRYLGPTAESARRAIQHVSQQSGTKVRFFS